MTDQLVRYHHPSDPYIWFVQPVGSQVPNWAIGVETCDVVEEDYRDGKCLDGTLALEIPEDYNVSSLLW